MIHYQLRCDKGDQFDGWFKDSDTFDKQSKAKALECPCCGSKKVSRDIMAPSVAKGAKQEQRQPSVAEKRAFDELLHEQRRLVEAHADNVGKHFSDVAHRMRDGKEPVRSIYGNASREQTIGLRERGVPVQQIPWPDAKPNRPATVANSRGPKTSNGNGSN